jgi:hypothetical protein
MDLLLVEHAIVAVAVIWLVHKAYSLGCKGSAFHSLHQNNRLLRLSAAGVMDALFVWGIRGVSVLPGVKGIIEKENQKIVEKIEVSVKNKELDELAQQQGLTFSRIPTRGLNSDQLLSSMRTMRGKSIEKAYATGKVFLPTHTSAREEKFMECLCLCAPYAPRYTRWRTLIKGPS